MLNFLLEPQKNKYAEEFTIINIPENSPIWRLLGLMVLDYANKTPDTQKVLKPMVISLSMYLSAEYKHQNQPKAETLADQITAYIESNSDSATLYSVAEYFDYHHVYLSRLLPEKTGKSFSSLLLDARMRRAKLLLDHTDLSIEKLLPCWGTAITAISIRSLNNNTESCQGKFKLCTAFAACLQKKTQYNVPSLL